VNYCISQAFPTPTKRPKTPTSSSIPSTKALRRALKRSLTLCEHADTRQIHWGSRMNQPHGGALINRIALEEEADEIRRRAGELVGLGLHARELNDLFLLADGAFSPLNGFMNRPDYEGVVDQQRLSKGLPWTIPITLSVEKHASLKEGSSVALRGADQALLGILEVQEIYPYSKQREAQQVYRTTDTAHPGVAALYAQRDLLIGGPVTLLPVEVKDHFALSPLQTRSEFERRGWRTIVGFQTRNPIHRAHEYVQKCALETVDGLLLHPLVGETKSDDTPAHVRMQCYQVLLERYYPRDRVLLSTLPAAMRYAGPREAIFHAIVRKNYGCTHFIVGRDHAGVGKYYGTYDAQKAFDEFSRDELGIIPLKFDNTFYCNLCESMASGKTCPHDETHHLTLSGTAVREMLTAGKLPPPQFSRREVAEILLGAS